MDKKRLLISLPLLVVLACAPGDENEELETLDEGDVPEEVSDESLSAWSVRLDDPTGDPGGLNLVTEGDGLTATSGAAGLAWRPIDLVTGGDFGVSATFEDRGGVGEGAYGLFVGGKNLTDPDQSYTFFMVRESGEYMIGHRDGEEVHTLVDWTVPGAAGAAGDGARTNMDSSAAVTTPPAPAAGAASQTLSVEVRGEDVRFLVNGTPVHTLPVAEAQAHGSAGIRLDPNVDVAVKGWAVNHTAGAAPR